MHLYWVINMMTDILYIYITVASYNIIISVYHMTYYLRTLVYTILFILAINS